MVRFHRFLFFLCLLCSVASFGSAKSGDAIPLESEKKESKKRKKPKVTIEELDQGTLSYIHYRLSRNILGLANRVDRFFANEKAILERNATYVLFDQVYVIGYEQNYDLSVRANLSLPGTEDRVNIFIENKRNQFVNRGGFDGSQSLGDEDDETRVGARFGIFGAYSKTISVTTRAGIKSLGFTWVDIDPFAEIRGRYTKTWTSFFLTEGHITPRISVADSKEIETGINFDFTPLDKWLFRFANNSLWEQNINHTRWLSGVSVVYSHTDEKAVLASLGVESRDSGGPHISGYNASLQYQQTLFYKWLNLQLTNFWEMPKKNNFRRISSFEILLRVRFGAL